MDSNPPSSSSSPTINLPDGRQLAYSLDSAPADVPVVVLASPLCASYAIWDQVVPVLNEAGFRCLRFNQPGHGTSSSPRDLTSTTFASMADDVAELVRALGIARLHAWVGVSMGAAMGLFFATRHRGLVARLVICDTNTCSPTNAGADDPFGPRIAAARGDGSLESTAKATRERWLGTAWIDAHPAETERLRAVMLSTSLDGFETCCHALRSPTFDARPLFAEIGASVDAALCVIGDRDAALRESMAEMRAKIEAGFASAGRPSRVELAVIPDAGHVCFVDGFDHFSRVITAFLKA